MTVVLKIGGARAVDPAVRDPDKEASLVVADPRSAGFGVSGGDSVGTSPIQRGLLARSVDGLIAVGGDDDRRVGEDLPREDERTHARL